MKSNTLQLSSRFFWIVLIKYFSVKLKNGKKNHFQVRLSTWARDGDDISIKRRSPTMCSSKQNCWLSKGKVSHQLIKNILSMWIVSYYHHLSCTLVFMEFLIHIPPSKIYTWVCRRQLRKSVISGNPCDIRGCVIHTHTLLLSGYREFNVLDGSIVWRHPTN